MDTTQALALHDGAAVVAALADEGRDVFLAEAVSATVRQLAADLAPRLGDALAEAAAHVTTAAASRDAAQAECDRLDARLADLRHDESAAGREADKKAIRQAQAAVAEAQVYAGRALAEAEAVSTAARTTAIALAAKYEAVAELAGFSAKVAS